MLFCSLLSTAAPASLRAQEPPRGPATDLCPAGAPDSDADTLCDAAEAQYGTDPSEPDTDKDSLSDATELFGMWVDGVTEDNEPQWLDLHALEADPLYKDVFVEIDYFPNIDPNPEALELVVKAFRDAPVKNPNGENGIRLHYVIDSEIAVGDAKPVLGRFTTPPGQRNFPCPEGSIGCTPHDTLGSLDIYEDFDPIKAKYANPLRHGVYHYALYANLLARGAAGVSFHINGHDFIVTRGVDATLLDEAGTFMHELGHNLGLRHGGDEDENLKPNYFSVMNYYYQSGMLRDGSTVIDYSRHPVDELSEASLNEELAMAPAPGTESTEENLALYTGVTIGFFETLMGNASFDLDFNRDGEITSAPYALDLDGNNKSDDVFRASQHDWSVLEFDGRGSIGQGRSWSDYESDFSELATHAPCPGGTTAE